jgi:hypothetical protein
MIWFDPHIKKRDLDRWQVMAASGKQEVALEQFIVLYNLSLSARYAKYLSDRMNDSLMVLNDKQIDDISIKISSATTGYKKAIKSVYREFVGNVYFDKVFKALNIKNPIVKRTIQNNTIKKFYQNIDGALSQTDRMVVSEIRKLQVDLIKHKRELSKIKDMAGLIDKERAAFRLDLEKQFEKKHIDFFKMKDDQAYVKYKDGKLVNFEAYNEMATRTTTLNVEREAVEINEKIEGRRVSEYVLRDNRTLKTKPREICKHIMARRFYGKALVAHDGAAAEVFGIQTIEGARAEGAMGPNCRHSIRPLPEKDYNRIDNILFYAEKQVV